MQINLFELAEMQLIKEGKEPTEILIIDYAIVIRAWFDKHRGIGDKILAGDKVYQYGNRFVTANR